MTVLTNVVVKIAILDRLTNELKGVIGCNLAILTMGNGGPGFDSQAGNDRIISLPKNDLENISAGVYLHRPNKVDQNAESSVFN